MTLSFKTQIDGYPTYFIEKIWTAFNLGEGGYQIDFAERQYWLKKCTYSFNLDTTLLVKVGIKIHTIRSDKKNRWRVGMPIHFVVKNRRPQRFQFAPIIPCRSLQTFEIEWYKGYPIVVIDGIHFYNPIVGIDNGMKSLAKNDGFDSLEEFFKYFNSDFKGKIIHWTDCIYSS